MADKPPTVIDVTNVTFIRTLEKEHGLIGTISGAGENHAMCELDRFREFITITHDITMTTHRSGEQRHFLPVSLTLKNVPTRIYDMAPVLHDLAGTLYAPA